MHRETLYKIKIKIKQQKRIMIELLQNYEKKIKNAGPPKPALLEPHPQMFRDELL